MIRWLASLFLLILPSGEALAAGKIFYGSRAGMTVTVIAKAGIDGPNASIRTKHTKEDAIGFCREYVGKVTKKCVQEELATVLSDEIKGNCATGKFTNFFGEDHQFLGEIKSGKDDFMAKYGIKRLATGEVADGSSASGYSTNMAVFRALCPSRAPPEKSEY